MKKQQLTQFVIFINKGNEVIDVHSIETTREGAFGYLNKIWAADERKGLYYVYEIYGSNNEMIFRS